MITIVGCNKGGVGKSTTAINVAVALAMQGYDVCLVDADDQHSAANWYARREEKGLTPTITLVEKKGNIAVTLRQLDEKYQHVIVDVAGRNSREFITGGCVAHNIIAPHQCSQFDMDTLSELEEQVIAMRDQNPELKVFCYQTLATTNPVLQGRERFEFLEFLKLYELLTPMKAIGYVRKTYKDAIPEGKSVLELNNPKAKDEVLALVAEVFN